MSAPARAWHTTCQHRCRHQKQSCHDRCAGRSSSSIACVYGGEGREGAGAHSRSYLHRTTTRTFSRRVYDDQDLRRQTATKEEPALATHKPCCRNNRPPLGRRNNEKKETRHMRTPQYKSGFSKRQTMHAINRLQPGKQSQQTRTSRAMHPSHPIHPSSGTPPRQHQASEPPDPATNQHSPPPPTCLVSCMMVSSLRILPSFTTPSCPWSL